MSQIEESLSIGLLNSYEDMIHAVAKIRNAKIAGGFLHLATSIKVTY